MAAALHPFESRRLWSLWDMFALLVGHFHYQLDGLRIQADLLKKAKEHPEMVDRETLASDLRQSLEGTAKSCGEFQLLESKNHIDRVLAKMARQVDYNYLHIHLEDIRLSIEHEGRNRQIEVIPLDRSRLMTEEPHPWGALSKPFPSVGEDTYSAIHCYMCDENTASVFHCMRILEAGLRAFAEALNVPFGAEVWHVVLDQIEAEVRELERTWPKGKTKGEFLQFYSAAAKEFRYFKDGWRNYVSHNHASYDAPQALSAINHVRDFMLQLSLRLSEAP